MEYVKSMLGGVGPPKSSVKPTQLILGGGGRISHVDIGGWRLNGHNGVQ